MVTCASVIPLAEAAAPESNLASATRERRVALVIGNSAYAQGPLVNPVNDARAMAKQLRSLGFDVVLRENLKARDIGGVYREFRSKIAPGGVALVFYAGHGVQFKGQNYFPAIDADIHSEEDVPLQSLNLGNLLDNMEEAKAGVSLVFLDACRDNPFARRFRSSTRGLAKVEAASGTLIHYATKPGSVASDGEGKNGTYTEALLAMMSQPGVPVEQMLKRVANRVVDKTKGKQEPWVEGSLRGDFYFVFQGPTAVNVQQAQADPEGETWSAAQGANTISGYQTYLDAYPNGRYSHAAKIKLTDLQKPATIRTEGTSVIAAQIPSQVAPQTVECAPTAIAKSWLRQLDAAIASKDASAIIAMFAPEVAVRATVRGGDGKMASIDMNREELMKSTLASMAGLTDYKQRRVWTEGKQSPAAASTTCDRINLKSVVVEQGKQSGKPYRFEAMEEIELELRAGKWLSTKAETTQQ